MIEEKEFVLEIMKKVTEFNLKMCEIILKRGIIPDALWMWSDLCYKNGMFFYQEFLKNWFSHSIKR